MGRVKHTAEQIIAKLHEVEVLQSQGKTIAECARQIGVSEMTITNVEIHTADSGLINPNDSKNLNKRIND